MNGTRAFLSIELILAYMSVSSMFFGYVTKKIEMNKAEALLKYFCILTMPLAIEALIRSIICVHDVWGYIEICTVCFLAVSLLVLCFCVCTLNNRFAKHMTRGIYISVAISLVAMIVIFHFG